MRVLVCGDRLWTDRRTIYNELDALLNPRNDMLPEPGSVVIHGGCGHFDAEKRIQYGADRIADDWAVVNWVVAEEYLADWARFGKAAGPRRNAEMLAVGKPDQVLAFHAEIERSRGTRDMLRRARTAGVPCRLVTGREDDTWR